ncbi:MAG: epoxyqueuosine reductase [Chlamydiales bacterium]|jgi:epoxyqueuosine reductase
MTSQETSISLEEIRAEALRLGWDDVGVTAAKIPEEDIAAYQRWLEQKAHADLKYMENQVRCNPSEMLASAKSAIIFVSYYRQEKLPFRNDSGLVASYARGRDYHNIHRKRLKKFIRWMEERSGQKEIARGFSDSAPVLEKALAVQAGLGWFGKNTLLIHRRFGTFILLSGLFTTLDLEHTRSHLQLRIPRCGSCQKCIDACPVNAFSSPYVLDANRCLSYHLIESKNQIPEDIKKQNPGYVFGCDICQDVCPHNHRKALSTTADFSSEKGMGPYLSNDRIQEFKENPEILYGSPLNRRGAEGLDKTFSSLKEHSWQT